ncbi:MAG: HipA N-terminal domain-containing protein [Bacteroidota bacterium]
MMRKAAVFRNGILAGILIEENRHHYTFTYDEQYYLNPNYPPISLTMPKTQKRYEADFLFPFFFNMLSEGSNKKLQCLHLRIDENDHFDLLVKTARYDTIGPITVNEINKLNL